MPVIELILYAAFFGFLASRIAVMLYDFLSYGEIFGGFKLWIAGIYEPELTDIFKNAVKDLSKSQAQEESLIFYDNLAHGNFLIGLLDCKFCLCIWTSIPFIIGSGVSFESFLIPIFAYLITEKL